MRKIGMFLKRLRNPKHLSTTLVFHPRENVEVIDKKLARTP
jgi:hypothetical protein